MYCILLYFCITFTLHLQSITMKKIFLLILSGALTMMSFTDLKGSDKIYRFLEEKYDAFSMSLSKDISDFFDLDVDLNGNEKLITGDFKKGKLLVTSKLNQAKIVNEMFLSEGYESIDIKDKGEIDEGNINLFIMRKGKLISEAHFVVEEEETVILLSVFGNIKVKDGK